MSLPSHRITEGMIDALGDALSDAGMEVVYADRTDDGQQVVYAEACMDAREPMRDGLARALDCLDAPGEPDASHTNRKDYR